MTAAQDGGPLSPGFRLGLVYLEDLDQGDAANWRWFHGKASLCALRLDVAVDLVAESCMGAELGTVRGKGVAIARPETETRFWFAVVAEESLRYEAEGLFAELNAGVAIPTTRYQFAFTQPLVEIHKVPWAGLWTGLGGGMRFF